MNLQEVVKKAYSRGYSRNEIISLLSKKGYTRVEINEALGVPSLKSQTKSPRQEYSFIDKIQMLFSHPLDYFERVQEDSLVSAFTLFSCVAVLVALFQYGLSYIFRGMFTNYFLGMNSLFYYSSYYSIFFVVFQISGSFIFSGIIYALAKMFGGIGNYSDSYRVVAYPSIAGLIISIIPIVGLLGWIYSLVLLIFGVAIVHQLSKGKAVLVVFLPLIILFIFYVVLILWILFSFRGLF